jgi:Cof subfamily protein (haloacid dehalogenase superfamily)
VTPTASSDRLPALDTSSLDLPPVEEARRLRFVALDMDGTLARTDHSVAPEFWPVARELLDRGIVLCAASGRQRNAIVATMEPVVDRIMIRSENGAAVWDGENVVRAEAVDASVLAAVTTTVRELRAAGHNVGLLAATPHQAYVESTDELFLEFVTRYNPNVAATDDLTALPHDVVKIAVWSELPATEVTYPAIAALGLEADTVRSAENWIDVMRTGTSKGASLRRVISDLGIAPEECAAFGDHHNDLTMLQSVGMSFAIGNAEPEVKDVARFVAPTNDENGVARVLRALLDA